MTSCFRWCYVAQVGIISCVAETDPGLIFVCASSAEIDKCHYAQLVTLISNTKVQHLSLKSQLLVKIQS